ncbi:MAG: SPOR domain-containing protein [Methylacidiphilales bacterium]|nr:SPOR domain-containing protein [Candidatus Methylacidiphilales bacterium]
MTQFKFSEKAPQLYSQHVVFVIGAISLIFFFLFSLWLIYSRAGIIQRNWLETQDSVYGISCFTNQLSSETIQNPTEPLINENPSLSNMSAQSQITPQVSTPPISVKPNSPLPQPPIKDSAKSQNQFIVQIGVFSQKQNADRIVTALKRKGIPAKIIVLQFLDSKNKYQLHLGPFASETEAKAYSEKQYKITEQRGIIKSINK